MTPRVNLTAPAETAVRMGCPKLLVSRFFRTVMSFPRSRWSLALALPLAALPVTLALVAPARAVQAPQPEAEPSALIDRLVAQRWQEKGVTPAPVCDDRTFVRRVYLDLAGRIPTPQEAEAFVADKSGQKRTSLVDRLLAGPEYAARMRDVFDVVFMGRPQPNQRRRRGGPAAVDFRKEWLAYLERSFAENRPWDSTVRSMLLARPGSPAEKGAVWFLYARQEKYQEIAEAISPAVFGIQVQCAQCHDHPLSPEIKQAHYWGLVAFFNRSKNKNTKDGPRVAETAVGGFSNFANLSGESSPAELTFLSDAKIPEQRPPDGAKQEDTPDLYQPAPAGSEEPPVPKFSRRKQFVEQVVKGNPLIAKAAVNRFWALLLGRGLVHPVDKMDSTHPPSHPELLQALAQDFTRSGYDVKRLVRALVLSKPYQLEARPPANAHPDSFAYALDKPLTAEALYRSLLVATTGKAEGENPQLREELVEIFPDVFPEEHNTTLRQSMFLTNNALVQQLLQPATGNTTERLVAIADPAARVREAFRIAYGRDPDADELKHSTAFLTARPDRQAQATQQLWWAVLTGAEFRINH